MSLFVYTYYNLVLISSGASASQTTQAEQRQRLIMTNAEEGNGIRFHLPSRFYCALSNYEVIVSSDI